MIRGVALAAAAAAVTAAVVVTADWGAVRRGGVALATRPFPLVVALTAYTFAFVLRAAAWGPLLPAPVALGRRFRAILAMLAVNHALPGPVGELARARIVTGAGGGVGEGAGADDDGATLAGSGAAPPAGVTFRGALASVAAARAVDVGALAVLAMSAAALAGEAPRWLRLVAPCAALLPAVAWFLARRRGATLTPPQAVRVAAWALPSWALEAGVILVVARAAGVELSPAAAMLATCGGVLAQVAAVLPGGVGTYEAGVASVLVPLGVPLGEAVGVAATAHAVKFAYAFAAGGLALAWPRLTTPRSFSEASVPHTAIQASENPAPIVQAADVRP